MKIERRLDAIVHNTFRDNPAKLASWESARHVQRSPRHKQAITSPPAAPKHTSPPSVPK